MRRLLNWSRSVSLIVSGGNLVRKLLYSQCIQRIMLSGLDYIVVEHKGAINLKRLRCSSMTTHKNTFHTHTNLLRLLTLDKQASVSQISPFSEIINVIFCLMRFCMEVTLIISSQVNVY